MIDDKKIEDAARYYCNNRYPASQDAPFIAEGFRHGAKWAVNELLKDLWHPASEKPADNEDILVESTFGSTSYELSLGMYYCIDECDEYHGDSWEVQSAKQRITRWLYVDDLLPKEGGEQ